MSMELLKQQIDIMSRYMPPGPGTAAIFVGMISSLTWILLSRQAFRDVYGLPDDQSIIPFSQPAIRSA